MVAAAEANGDYHVRVTEIVAGLGILGGEIELEATKAKASSVTSWLGSAAQGLWDAATNVVGVLSKAYDVISLGAHAGLSVGGMVPLVGGLFDLADLALTAVELPFGKSDRRDLALATLSIATTAAPGPVDAAAGGAKIGVRVGKIGGKIADGIAAAGKGLDELGSAGPRLVATSTLARCAGDLFEESVKNRFSKKIIRQNEILKDSAGKVIGEIDFETAEAIAEVGLSLRGKVDQLHRLAEVAMQRGKRLDVIYGPDTSLGTLRFLQESLAKKWGNRVRFIPHE
jgi:hypothetical protein